MAELDLLERRHRVLGRHAPMFYDEPLHLVRGEGVWVEDIAGRRYLDVYNNVPHVGHCHPRVVEAMCRQARALNIHSRYLHDAVVDYAERLTARFAAPLSVALFCCTGTEANELAIRMARFLTGGTGLIVTDFSYHGHSITLAEATTGIPSPEAVGRNVRTIPIPDLATAEPCTNPDTVRALYVAKVVEAIASFKAAGIKVAAILLDSIFSTEGLPKVPAGYVAEIVQIVRAAGGLFIADEVQPGFGRMGDRMWGYEASDLIPDFVTLGKPMGNGHPLGGVVTHADYLERFASKALYFNTFGGNPVSAAVGMAVLDVIESEGLVENADRVGKYIQSGLSRLAEKHQLISVVRGQGLFFGLELVKDRATLEPATAEARRAINMMRERGVLISKIGVHDNVLKMRPPMPFSRDDADLLLEALDGVLGDIGNG
jgi:4-aminobutyrate aminotransferase-like enzyme